MHYRPCTSCARKTACPKYDALRIGIEGLGITSLSINCGIMQADFSPGDRIITVQRNRYWVGVRRGTFIEWIRGRGLVRFDHAIEFEVDSDGDPINSESEIKFAKLHHAEMSRLQDDNFETINAVLEPWKKELGTSLTDSWDSPEKLAYLSLLRTGSDEVVVWN